MKSIKVILIGIVVILASLFCMGIVIINDGGGSDRIAIRLFIVGIIICIIGSFFVKDKNYDTNNDSDDDTDDDNDEDEEQTPM